ncbi:MAG: molybdopterin-binding protein [Microthrixaceae bacterium]|nr:molybdopterin-binding protein [Microthrixaceae bacterium]
MRDRLAEAGYDVVEHRVISDGVNEVANALTYMAYGFNGLVVTTGGTGFRAPRRYPRGHQADPRPHRAGPRGGHEGRASSRTPVAQHRRLRVGGR